jgi:hypothetical protein
MLPPDALLDAMSPIADRNPSDPPPSIVRPMLEMRSECERCATTLAADGPAVICSFECTFCVACGEAMSGLCPNCGGELVARPRRAV